ncbi:MAG: DUF4263 domain-containing protein [Acidobacteriota bacterium]|nr:DUF4263 domain-containing protein [Acidobacteriota bacterium]
MDYAEIREYQIKQRSRNIAETPWLILPGDNKLTRRLVKLGFIKDHSNPDKFVGIHSEMLYQKRTNQKTPWPAKTVNLTTIPRDLGFKFFLDSAQTYELTQSLLDAYSIGDGKLKSGKRTVVSNAGNDEIIVTQKNKAEVLRQLTSMLDQDDLTQWLSQNIDAISTDLAFARLYHDRKAKLDELRLALTQDEAESFWQKFLKGNSWMFGSSCVELLPERRLDIHHTTDFPMAVDGGFMDIVEIKTPQMPFWANSAGKRFKYRNKFLIPHIDLQGAIAQTTKYILQAEMKVDSEEYIKDHGGIVPLKPRGLVIQGRSNDWGKDEWEAFRLLNDELHSVQVITFDHLLKQAERMLAVMKVPDDNPHLEELTPDEIEDFPL